MKNWIVQIWYKQKPISWYVHILSPFSYVYRFIVAIRRKLIIQFLQQRTAVPVIVVGNIVVGGVGKTPMVIAMANQFKLKGLRVGIVSRGYGAQSRIFPCNVTAQSNPILVGDEPFLLAQRTECPVVIDPNRVRAVRYLLSHYACDVIISDDGLQHYAMARAVELLMVDGERWFGNGYCLPAGPLREPIPRWHQVDFVVCNGNQRENSPLQNSPMIYPMECIPVAMVQLTTGKIVSLDKMAEYFKGSIAAVAGIGNPGRFFTSLRGLGIHFNPHPFPDHYRYTLENFNFSENWVFMTEKDAVKCKPFAKPHWYYLKIDAMLPQAFWQEFYAHPVLKRLIDS